MTSETAVSELKSKTERCFQSVKNAAKNVFKKIQKENELNSLNEKALMSPIPITSTSVYIDSKDVKRIAQKQIEATKQEEERIKKDLSVLETIISEMEKIHVATIADEENERAKKVKEHSEIERIIKEKIERTEEKLQNLNRKYLSLNENSKKAQKLQKSMEKYQNSIYELIKSLKETDEKHEKDIADFMRHIEKRKRTDNKTLQKYLKKKRTVELYLQERILVRKALEQKLAKDIASGLIYVSDEEATSATDFKNLQAFERRELRKASVFQIMQMSAVKELKSEAEITDYDGFVITNEKLGETFFGSVYKARQTLYGKEGSEFAVKIVDIARIDPLYANHLVNTGFKILRFVNKSPFKSLVEVHDIVEIANEQKVYIIEELFTKDLQTIIQTEGLFNEISVRPVVAALAEAINYLHVHGIAHQNINPRNVYRSINSTIKLSCLEFATICWDAAADQPILKQCSATRKETRFKAPEVCQGVIYNAMKADVYSFGELICYMLLMKCPFEIEEKDFEQRFSEVVISDAGRDFIHKCLEVEPNKRIHMHNAVSHEWLIS
ncbi:testis-specific serine/threonine-protein kinase 6-like protein [Dinothrombium tinctorium]|uniref:Testis-specific serine/threonine-protein kinase 6-like protein n=1 Tax=Dinothrombium tinctorium TaxID=1965070 RepID=A0A3S3PQ99_9ACAR|nr:testis-specific serine/threonine-protein kinase 6-like protein [Dinothrombium tinctorium]